MLPYRAGGLAFLSLNSEPERRDPSALALAFEQRTPADALAVMLCEG
ncbi:hypothetical protein [Aporhodopirellula rubra]|nr:hypothetical protein [Aporhodopirellula rubra]